MLRRHVLKLLGVFGLGGGMAASVDAPSFEGGVDMASGPDCAVTWGKDREVCVIRSGDKMSIFVMNGGSLSMGEGAKIDRVDIHRGGMADFSRADKIATVNDYRVEVGNYA